MLTIVVPSGEEFYDEESERFVIPEGKTLTLEHSLVSLSKWELIWEKPFLGPDPKTSEESLSYIHQMILTPDWQESDLFHMTEDNVNDINEYINKKATATWFTDVGPQKSSSQIVTNELIYYWMSALSIPIEAENWHLSRLFTLIRVVNQKNSPAKKMSRGEVIAKQRALNEQRRAALNSAG